MANSSDPERYSIDEMMDRLKERSGSQSVEEGQLVVRADGSQAIRVRKRKRRSEQVDKEQRSARERRVRMVQVTMVLVFIVLLIVGFGLVTVYVNSAPFRDGFIKKIANASGADVELIKFRMNPSGANADGVKLNWPEGNVLESLSLNLLGAEISPVGVFGSTVRGGEINAQTGLLVLHIPNYGTPMTVMPDVAGDSPFQFNHYNIKNFELKIRDADHSEIRLVGSESMFVPAGKVDHPQLILTKGDLLIPGWPNLRLDRAHIEFRNNEADIVGMRLRHATDPRGVCELRGTISPYRLGEESKVDIQMESYLLSGVIGEDFGKLIACRIDSLPEGGKSYLSILPGSHPEVSTVIDFQSAMTDTVQVANFPFLFGLSQTLGDEWFSQPMFLNGVSGKIHRTAGKVSIENMDFTSKGRMSICGVLTMDSNRQLVGHLDVGVAQGQITTSGNRVLEAMFGPPKEGFRWISLEIGGTTISPTDNFRKLFEEALNSIKAEPSVQKPEKPGFSELTQPR